MKVLTIYPSIRDNTSIHASEFSSDDSSTDRRRDISIHSNVQSLTQVLQKRSVCRYKTFHTIKTSSLRLPVPLYSLFHVSDLFDPLATVLLSSLSLSQKQVSTAQQHWVIASRNLCCRKFSRIAWYGTRASTKWSRARFI